MPLGACMILMCGILVADSLVILVCGSGIPSLRVFPFNPISCYKLLCSLLEYRLMSYSIEFKILSVESSNEIPCTIFKLFQKSNIFSSIWSTEVCFNFYVSETLSRTSIHMRTINDKIQHILNQKQSKHAMKLHHHRLKSPNVNLYVLWAVCLFNTFRETEKTWPEQLFPLTLLMMRITTIALAPN